MTTKTVKIKTMANIESNECRWPIGDPRDANVHFCGAQQHAGRPYCAAHWAMSFVPGRSRHQPAPVLRVVASLPVSRAA